MYSIKSFFTYLGRNKLYTAINIFGFVTSLTFVILMSLYLKTEFSVDSELTHKDRIYRLEDTNDGIIYAAPIAGDLMGRYAQFEHILRIFNFDQSIKVGDNSVTFEKILYADSTLFEFYPAIFIEGDPQRALETIDKAVLSREYAIRLFGSASQAIGKSLNLDDKIYTISAVIEKPDNISLKWGDIVIPFNNVKHLWDGYLTQYSSANFSMLALLKEGATFDKEDVKDCTKFLKTFYWPFQRNDMEFRLTPLEDVYWDGLDKIRYNSNSRQLVFTLTICVLLVLAFAVFNYVNLTVTQTQFRAKEAATRRLLGGTKAQLFSSFIIESFIICTISLALAVTMAYSLQQDFNSLMQSQISVNSIFSLQNIATTLLALITLSVISGIAPAMAIIKHKPIEVVRGDFRRRSKQVYGKVLIGIQYLITIVMLAMTYTVGTQTNFMINSDQGFEPRQLICVVNTYWNPRVLNIGDVLRKIPGVKEVSLSQGAPFCGANNMSIKLADERTFSFALYSGDSLLLDVLDIEIISQTGVKDRKAVWINETGLRKMGLDPNATQMPWSGAETKLPLAGVIKDFNSTLMSQQIEEAIIAPLSASMSGNPLPWSIMVKTQTNDKQQTLALVEEAYAKFTGGAPFDGRYLDDVIAEQYAREQQISIIISILSIIALVISALGILAMSTYFIKQRTKEIAIRKIFGSTKSAIFFKLVKLFLILLLVAFVIGVPIIYYLSESYLASFVYRAPLTVWGFIFAGAITLLVASVTLSYKAIEAIRMNPAKVIKME